LKLKI